MAASPGTLKTALEEWLDQNFMSGYTSCIKIHGQPILPPLMSEERRMEMRRLRDMAVEVESKIIRKRGGTLQEDSSGGEGLYEGTIDDPPFANSMPTSLAENTQALPDSGISTLENDNMVLTEVSSLRTDNDMLKEFDPLAEEIPCSTASTSVHLLDLHSSDPVKKISETLEKAVSKPGSAESSVALTYSTDLNNYMDTTESSFDVSAPSIDEATSVETGATTPSTVRPDSSDVQSQSSASWRDRKTTYEDLNNYLDSLLNNSSGSKNCKPLKDNNQNDLNPTCERGASPLNIQNPEPAPSLMQTSKLHNSDPLPLTSPPGSLQTRKMAENYEKTPPKQTVIFRDSNFLEDCNLSPVQGDLKSVYEQRVRLYLQNLMIDRGTSGEITENNSPQISQELEESNKETQSEFEAVSSNNLKNGTNAQVEPHSLFNGYLEEPPRLVRSNSYTLDSPSPMLLAHMEAELRKNVRNEVTLEERVRSSQNNGPSRRVWDVEKAKNMPSWCTRQNNVSSNQPKIQSPKKVVNRSSLPPIPATVHVEPPSNDLPKSTKAKLASKCSPDQLKLRKSFVPSWQQESSGKMLESTLQCPSNLPVSSEDSNDKMHALLLQVQAQHNKEMEELLNRQCLEKEVIRLALLKEQNAMSLKISEESRSKAVSPQNLAMSHLNTLSQSPPTKDRALVMERRNTSPSIYEKESTNEVQSCLLQYNKSSSISLDNISSSGDTIALIDFGCEEKTFTNRSVSCETKAFRNVQKCSQNSTDQPVSCGTLNQINVDATYLPYDMISSFPPVDRPSSAQLESMTCSLPTEILSLHFSNTEFTFNHANSVSCTSQSMIAINSPPHVTSGFTSVAQNIVCGGSPHSKRRSWCSRQLFPDGDWLTQSLEAQKHEAAAKIQAGVRGYLTRRLLKTERVQTCITTIRDTIVCALQLQRECAPHVEPSDLQLHGRLIQQLSAACEDLHNIFMGLPVAKRMAIISCDRERLRVRTPRSQSSAGSRPLSRATQIVLQRKMNQTDPSDRSSQHSRTSSASRSRRRSWATVESRIRPCSIPTTAANTCEVVAGCLSRSSAPASHPLQRSSSAGSSRKPWR